MEAIESGHVETDITMEIVGELAGETPVALEARVVGEFRKPDRNYFTMTMTTGGISVELETIVIGSDSYQKNPVTGAWEALPVSPTPFGNIVAFGAFNTNFAPEVADGFTVVGEEQLDGERVYYLKGPVSGEALWRLLEEDDDWAGAPLGSSFG